MDTIKECIIKHGSIIEVVRYDVCHSGTLDEAKSFYGDNFIYIGSSSILLINRIKQDSNIIYHCFIRKINIFDNNLIYSFSLN